MTRRAKPASYEAIEAVDEDFISHHFSAPKKPVAISISARPTRAALPISKPI
jgi:hypothetical protein